MVFTRLIVLFIIVQKLICFIFPQLRRSFSDPSIKATDTEVDPSINTPADIYERFYTSNHLSDSEEDATKPLKSILKKDSRSGSTENLKLRPILKSSPEHRPGTPEHLLDEPHSILKTPPDTQASEDKRPGTPENVLNDTATGTTTQQIYSTSRPSILKPANTTSTEREEYNNNSSSTTFMEDDQSLATDGDVIRPILKAHQHEMFGSATAETHESSFLTMATNSSSQGTNIDGYLSGGGSRSILKQGGSRTRAFSPDSTANTNRDAVRSVRITEPDMSQATDAAADAGGERPTILKTERNNKPV